MEKKGTARRGCGSSHERCRWDLCSLHGRRDPPSALMVKHAATRSGPREEHLVLPLLTTPEKTILSNDETVENKKTPRYDHLTGFVLARGEPLPLNPEIPGGNMKKGEGRENCRQKKTPKKRGYQAQAMLDAPSLTKGGGCTSKKTAESDPRDRE